MKLWGDLMKKGELLHYLCYRDKRYPDHADIFEEEAIVSEGECFCDNCFYGRSKLACIILDNVPEDKLRDY